MKKCRVCLQEKEHSSFYPTSGNADGYMNICKPCKKVYDSDRLKIQKHRDRKKHTQKEYGIKTNHIHNKSWLKTKQGYLSKTYATMKKRVTSINEPNYYGIDLLPKFDFYEFSKLDSSFIRLFNEYEKNGFKPRTGPSIDRIDPNMGYTLSNIRWITHSENSRNASITTPKGYDLSGVKIKYMTILRPAYKIKGGVFWECVCDCGTTKIVSGSSLLCGDSGSCGCKNKVKKHDFVGAKIDKSKLKKVHFCDIPEKS